MLSLKSLFQRQPEPLIGLDISATAVKLVELARHGQDGWTLERCTIRSKSIRHDDLRLDMLIFQ